MRFRDKKLAAYYAGTGPRPRGLPHDVARRLVIKLDLLSSAESLDDLRIPPSNRLEKLMGNRRGRYSIRAISGELFSPGHQREQTMSNSSTTTKNVHSIMPDIIVDSTPPGVILRVESLEPFGISQHQLASAIGVSEGQISRVISGKRAISADLSVRLGMYFHMSPHYFSNLQNIYDTRLAEARLADVKIEPFVAA